MIRANAIKKLAKNGQLFLLIRLSKLVTPFYKVGYITSLYKYGFIKELKDHPQTLEQLSEKIGISQRRQEALQAWLQVGIRLKLLKITDHRYALKGLAARLAYVENDALYAMMEEVSSLHHKLIVDTPERLKEDTLWTMQDQEGDLIARSSRIIEPVQREIIKTVFPSVGVVRLLEIGCGSGIYIRHAAMYNPQLEAAGVEMQGGVAEMARQNMLTWELQDRVKIEEGDIRNKMPHASFDILTLYNNIYYFKLEERENLLKHLFKFLKPGGFLVVTTACQGGQPVMELLNLWGAATENCGRLPHADEMMVYMKAAGFVKVRKKNLLPGDSFYLFVGYRP